MDNRPTSEYAQPGSHHQHPPVDAPSEQKPADQAAAASAYTPQPEPRPTQYTPEVRPNISASNTPQSDYGPPTARSPAYQDYLHRPSYAPNSQPGGGAGMAQATSPFNLPTGPRSPNLKADAPVPIDPSLPANSPPYPPPYSPYQPQGHEMAQYQGHPPPPQHMYARPDWPHSYGQQHHGLPGPYASPATTVGLLPPWLCLEVVTLILVGLLICPNSRCTAAQAPPSSLRGNRAHVQVWMEWLREGLWYFESLKRTRDYAVTRREAHS
jgi:hypothetical protein